MTISVFRVIRVPRLFDRGAKIATLIALFTLGANASAQVDPSREWRTISTTHFYVHYTPELEAQARRTAANAERAYTQLSSQLTKPRGKIDIVLSDAVDFSNGSATAVPTNRIVLYANPPVDQSALRFTDDWNALVVTHELTHIFHLDRSRGIWALGQHVFGRTEALFPNYNSPSWLTEGLAVHFESYFTGAGRLKGTEHYIIARAAALDRNFPNLNQLSLANPRFPFGESAYSYGSLIVDRMANEGGPAKMREFIEKSSAQLVPFFPDVPAREAFGKSFTTGWREWRDSVEKAAPAQRDPIIGWRELTHANISTTFPRWISPDNVLVYSGTNGKETFRAHRVDLNGKETKLGRRNSATPNVRLPDGSLLFSQLDFTGPYEERSDLWIERERTNLLAKLHLAPRFSQARITKNARVSSPDARASDGAIVAMQIVPAGTRLVRVSRDGNVTPITNGGIDEQWTEPRWSYRGDRIAAIRWTHGGNSSVVVIDTTGRVLDVIATAHAIVATPSWLPDDSGILYSNDVTGTPQIYLRSLASATSPQLRIGEAITGLFEPQVAPSDTTIAAVVLRGNGYRLGVGPCCKSTVDVTNAIASTAGTSLTAQQGRPATPPTILIDSSVSRPYSPWRTFWPRYWEPRLEDGAFDGDYRIGLATSGNDVIGRHAFDFDLYVPTKNTGIVWDFSYQYAGFHRPIFVFDAFQDWSQLASGAAGDLRFGQRGADLIATWLKPGVRQALSFSLGAGLENRQYASDPEPLLAQVDTGHVLRTNTTPIFLATFGYSGVQRPTLSISQEDGLTFAVTARERMKNGLGGTGPASLSLVGAATAFKSLDLPGFAHHVIALRGAAGWMDLNAENYLAAGGVSGTPIDIAPGYTVGEGRKTFPVRGFPAGSIAGVRMLGGTIAYRAPLFIAGRGIGRLPFYVDRVSLELFGEGAEAWCPSAAANRFVCTNPAQTVHQQIGSVGGELNVTTALFGWDDPYRLRLGVAAPVQNNTAREVSAARFYFAAGLSF